MESSGGMFTFCMASVCVVIDFLLQCNLYFLYEARLEAMMQSDPTDCNIRNGTCALHHTRRML